MNSEGIMPRPTIESTKNAKPAPRVFQRWRVLQRSTRWYQSMIGPSVCAAMFSDLSV